MSFTKRTLAGAGIAGEGYATWVADVRRRVDSVTAWAPALACHYDNDDAAAFDALAGHVQQTCAWAAVAVADRPRRASFALVREGRRPIGAALVLRLGPLAWIERGPSCAPSDLDRVLAALESAARRRGIARLAVSPYLEAGAAATLEARGYRADLDPGGPHRHTARVELADPLPSKLRSELRRAERHGARVEAGSAEGLARLARKSVAWARAVDAVPNAKIFYTVDAGGLVGAALVTVHRDLATYLVGAAVADPRPYGKLLLPLVAAMDWARGQGATQFDVGGVPSPGDDDPKRAAIARFKLDFGGSPVALIAPYRRWLVLP